MKKHLYEMNGIIIYFEQMTLLTGKIGIDEKTIDDKFIAKGVILENPGNRKYLVEGELSDVPEIRKMALDLIQTPLNEESTISYYMTKDYSNIKNIHVPIAGLYDGIRRDDMFKDLLEDDSKPMKEKVHEMVTNLTTSINTKAKIVVMELIYKGLVEVNEDLMPL